MPLIFMVCTFALSILLPPTLGELSRGNYWGWAGACALFLVGAALYAQVGSELHNGPLPTTIAFAVLPMLACFGACRIDALRRHPVWAALASPVVYALAVVAGMNLGMLIGVMHP